ncbi:adenylylsulfatase HINT3 [Gossypium australe]|uniref:Adenylylsulfatase HINT3 n=1 Tax=Gossypium australe TaxID=47621 RepID=A0A5B6W0E3_9ROSI|nr:adenylylsulfatase HINT3 [Gossypium australe]
MEARRLAILYSHLCPFPSASVPSLSSIVSPSACAPQSKETFPHDCVFCQIIRGDSPAFKLYEDDMCLCILDTRPLSPGHSLIIPKSHFPSLDTTPPSVYAKEDFNMHVVAAMCSKVPFISNAIIKVTGADSFNLLVNNGVAAGQVIFHISLNNAYTDLDDNFEWFVYDIKFQTHVHIIPRKAGDCLWTSESLHRRTLKVDQETSGLANRVRELLLKISEENKDQVSTLS